MASNFGAKALGLALLFSVLALWFMGYPVRSYAYSCGSPGSPTEAMAAADAVFIGRAVAVGEIGSPDSFTTEFLVSTVWKGPTSRKALIETGGMEEGYSFDVGGEYLVYAYALGFSHGETEVMWTGFCSRTVPLSKALDDLTGLGAGQAISKPPPEAVPWALISFVALAVGLSGTGLLVRRKLTAPRKVTSHPA